MNVESIEKLEIITAITLTYQDDIEGYLLEKDNEVLQSEFAMIVQSLYFAYLELEERKSLLDLINSKEIEFERNQKNCVEVL